MHFLSFPWVLSDILARVYHENTTKKEIPFRSLHTEISDSIKEIFDGLHECVAVSRTLIWILTSVCVSRNLLDNRQQHQILCKVIESHVKDLHSSRSLASAASCCFT